MSTQAHEAFRKSMERAQALLEIHRYITKDCGRPPGFASDMLRAALVFIMASWDSYLHDVIQGNVYALINKQKGKNLPKKLIETLKEALPYDKMIEVWHKEKPGVIITTAIRKRNAEKTFMKPEKLEEAFKILGIEDIWAAVARKLHRRADGLRTDLTAYCRRRDKIAHEGDRGKATRSKGKLGKIRRTYVEKAFNDINMVAQAIDEAVEEKLRSP